MVMKHTLHLHVFLLSTVEEKLAATNCVWLNGLGICRLTAVATCNMADLKLEQVVMVVVAPHGVDVERGLHLVADFLVAARGLVEQHRGLDAEALRTPEQLHLAVVGAAHRGRER